MKKAYETTTWRRRGFLAVAVAPVALLNRPAFADEAQGPPITVKVPLVPGVDGSGRFAGFRCEFTRTARKGEATEYYRLNVKELPTGELQFHRRNDNGVAGSGVLATVRFEKQETSTEVVMVFQQLSQSSYQEGLFLKKAVPAFALKDLLVEGTLGLQFELDSEYPMEAVRANFKRLGMLAGSPGGREMYRLSTASGQQYVTVQFFPYRSGSKVTATAVIAGKETSPGVVDFGKLVRDVQEAVQAVVKA